MWLNPAWSRPTSLPSSTSTCGVEVAALDFVQAPAQGEQRV